MNVAIAIPANVHRLEDDIGAVYSNWEPKMLGLIKTKARRWHTRGAGPFDDLVQEGRCALLQVLRTHDPDLRPIHVYLGKVLDNKYGQMLESVLTQKRTPHIWEQEGDEWRLIPYPALSLDAPALSHGDGERSVDLVADAGMTPEQTAIVHDKEVQAKVLLIRLRARLSPKQRRVLDCLIKPSGNLAITARNLTGGSQRVCNTHIAAYLRTTKNSVDHAILMIRRNARVLIAEMAEGCDS